MKASSPHSQGSGTSSQYSAATSTKATISPNPVETTTYWPGAAAKPVNASTNCGRWAAAAASPTRERTAVQDQEEQQRQDERQVKTTPVAPVTTRWSTPTRLSRSNRLTAASIWSWVTPRSPSH